MSAPNPHTPNHALFPELAAIFNKALERGDILPERVASIDKAQAALAWAIQEAILVPIGATTLGRLVKHLVNVTIADLQTQLDEARASTRIVSQQLNESEARRERLRLQLDQAPKRMIGELEGRAGFDGWWDSLDGEIKDEVGDSLRSAINQEPTR